MGKELRFCLAKGAKLRKEYHGVEDFKTPYNTLNLTYVLYAVYQKPTMSPKLLKEFSKELFFSGTEHSLDYHFRFLCMNSAVIERDSIVRKGERMSSYAVDGAESRKRKK